jgi:hypothetical protein
MLEFPIPKFVIDMYKEKYSSVPSLTQTQNILATGLQVLIEKNKKLWFDRIKHSDFIIEKKGLIEYGDMMIYYERNKDENIYKIFILSNTESEENINLLIVGLKKYQTIN